MQEFDFVVHLSMKIPDFETLLLDNNAEILRWSSELGGGENMSSHSMKVLQVMFSHTVTAH